MSTFRDNSRGDWTGHGTIEHINAGSLQRIADAALAVAVKCVGYYTPVKKGKK